MPFDQESLNKNLTNGLSVVNKALINSVKRQKVMFDILGDSKLSELCLLDLALLEDMQRILERMKGLV